MYVNLLVTSFKQQFLLPSASAYWRPGTSQVWWLPIWWFHVRWPRVIQVEDCWWENKHQLDRVSWNNISQSWDTTSYINIASVAVEVTLLLMTVLFRGGHFMLENPLTSLVSGLQKCTFIRFGVLENMISFSEGSNCVQLNLGSPTWPSERPLWQPNNSWSAHIFGDVWR